MTRIKLITYNVENQLLQYIKIFLMDIKDVSILAQAIQEIPIEYFNEIRKQYRGDLINRWLYRVYRDTDIIIGVLNVDAYVPPLNFVFGVANPRLMVCSVYLPRLEIGVGRRDFYIRVKKEVFHELSHLYGLGHCINKKCVMSFSNSLYEVDEKTFKFCKKHFRELIDSGLQLPDNYKL